MNAEAYPYDEAQIAETRETARPTLRIYRFPETAIVLGRASKPEVELSLTECAADHAAARVALYRRRGGGCSVVLDPGNLVVSVGLPVPGLAATRETFDRITAWLVEALRGCGIDRVESDGVSDLVCGDRKFGGSCLYRTHNLLFYSLSLLVEPRLELIERYLRHPPREPEYRRGRPHREFVLALGEQLGEGALERLEGELGAALRIEELWPPAR
ncbi:MAG: hypothetical protein KC609_11330 [Myxococcales bacterium]|nr:hypothetical protein [Myxococcales bacterium]